MKKVIEIILYIFVYLILRQVYKLRSKTNNILADQYQ